MIELAFQQHAEIGAALEKELMWSWKSITNDEEKEQEMMDRKNHHAWSHRLVVVDAVVIVVPPVEKMSAHIFVSLRRERERDDVRIHWPLYPPTCPPLYILIS